MENYPITQFEILLRNDELLKIETADGLRTYLNEVVSPVICDAMFSSAKGGEVRADVSCSRDRGCEVHVGGSIRF